MDQYINAKRKIKLFFKYTFEEFYLLSIMSTYIWKGR